jgi:hypothetical protein
MEMRSGSRMEASELAEELLLVENSLHFTEIKLPVFALRLLAGATPPDLRTELG